MPYTVNTKRHTCWQHLGYFGERANLSKSLLCGLSIWIFYFSGNLEIIYILNCSWKTTAGDPCASCFEEQVHWGLKLPLDQCQGIQVLAISCCLGLLPWHKLWIAQWKQTPAWTSGLAALEPLSDQRLACNNKVWLFSFLTIEHVCDFEYYM